MTQRVTIDVARKRRTPPLTQEELANLVQVDQTYISLIEAGKRHPSDELRDRLATALGIAPSRLRFIAPRPAATVQTGKDKPGQPRKSSKSIGHERQIEVAR